MLESIIVEPGVNINDILVGDKNAILVASRMLAFGADYDVSIDDPETGEPTPVTIDLSQIQTKSLDKELLNRKNEYDFIQNLKILIDNINLLNQDELKQFHKQKMRETAISDKGAAGLGFIDIARKTRNPLEYHFERIDKNNSFFFFKTTISRS